MNIFVTSKCPVKSAENICYVHVVKMITEGCQMLSTAHHVLDGEDAPEGLYKKTHQNHPCNQWIRLTDSNYNWLLAHTKALGYIYTKKTGKVHGALEQCLEAISEPPKRIACGPLTRFARAMDDDLKMSIIDTHEAYKAYLNRKYLEWLTRKKPVKVEFVVATPEWLDYSILKLINK